MFSTFKKLIKLNIYPFLIFTYFVLCGFSKLNSLFKIEDWIYSSYLLDYKVGFGSRLFIGEVFNRLLDGKVYMHSVSIFCICFSLLLCAVVAKFLGDILNKCRFSCNEFAVIYLVLIYLAIHANISVYLTSFFLGRFESYLLGIFFVMFFMFLKFKQNFGFWGILTILSVLSIAIHQVYFFTIFPIILAFLAYNLYKKKFDIKSLVYSAVFVLISLLAFVYFQFESSLNLSLNELLNYAASKSDINIFNPSVSDLYQMPYQLEYYSSLKDKTVGFVNSLFVLRSFERMLLFSMLVVPLILFFKRIISSILKNATDKTEKYVFIFMQSMAVFFIPLFILATDWGRWFVLLVNFEFAIFFYLINVKSTAFEKALSILKEKIKTNPFMYLFFILYVAIFSYTLINVVSDFPLFGMNW